jgi:hypothetical protein
LGSIFRPLIFAGGPANEIWRAQFAGPPLELLLLVVTCAFTNACFICNNKFGRFMSALYKYSGKTNDDYECLFSKYKLTNKKTV